ncbi:MAG TPA: hypothetical protein VFV84_13175 [Burkholderiales bacterium]|nr:hypothetical protein [Burkholderiales bacterium]
MIRAFALLALLASGCASFQPAPSARVDSADAEARACAQWYLELDQRVARVGVRDAQARPVEGFPYLRVDRLLAALRGDAGSDPARLAALVQRMQALDAEGRRAELANLEPDAARARGDLDHARACAQTLRAADLADGDARMRLLERAQVPDDYSTGERVLGLYVLTKYPFFSGVRQYQHEVTESFAAPLARPTQRYAPGAARAMPRREQAEAIARASRNPLGIPEPAGEDLERLFAAHAPVFEVEQTGDFDVPGALRWARGANTPTVDPADLVVYRSVAWTRYHGRTLLQLVYTIWFPARPAASGTDLLSGALDGIVWRVTLAPDGEPLVYDTMHPCGCYHMFFPTPLAQPRPSPESVLEWMFSPLSLPRVAEGERPVLRIATRTHYLERVRLEAGGADDGPRYALRDYDALRSMPRPEGGRASAFDPDGLVEGTERAERFLFWPMGIDSPGAMRQWGRHATAFVGRRHFDDADLLEKRFELQLR